MADATLPETRAPARRQSPATRKPTPAQLSIGSYRDARGRAHAILGRSGAGGSRLVVDRDLESGEERLVAHIGVDEPEANAALVARLYLEAAPELRGCRRAARCDELVDPFPADALGGGPGEREEWPIVGGRGAEYRLARLPSRMSIPQLRWSVPSAADPNSPVSLREAIARLERYEPLCALTRAAIVRHREDPAVSTTVLRAELARVLDSPIVLNRALREAVLARVASRRSSLSEIAIRCGRVKRDRRGNVSGETSWLARRIGLLPEGGRVRADAVGPQRRARADRARGARDQPARGRARLSAPTAILLVESDRSRAEALAVQLAADGYRVELARSVAHARSLAAAGRPQVAILGRIEIPRGAIALIEEIRAAGEDASCWWPSLPALVLGSPAGELAAVRAFEAGADDFMPAGVGYLELRARMRAVLRRSEPARAENGVLRVGALAVDQPRRVATLNGRRLELRRMEYELLVELAREPARIFAREELLRTVWGFRCPGSTRTVDATRAVCAESSAGGPWVIGVRGLGYRLT